MTEPATRHTSSAWAQRADYAGTLRVLVLGALFLVGCAGQSVETWWDGDPAYEQYVAEQKKIADTERFRLLVAPISDFQGRQAYNDQADPTQTFAPVIDLDDLRVSRLIPLLREPGRYAAVDDAVQAASKQASIGEDVRKRIAAGDRDAIMDLAWDLKYDFVLFAGVKSYTLRYSGVATTRYVLNSFLWFWTLAPSWWIADLGFQADLQMSTELVSVHSRVPILENRDFENATKEVTASTMDRGWGFMDIFRFFSSMGRGNWDTLHQTIFPAVAGDVLLQVGRHLEPNFEERLGAQAFAKKMKKRMALCISVTDYREDALPDAFPSTTDEASGAAVCGASQMRDLLTSAQFKRSYGYFDVTVKTLINEEVTRDGIKRALDTEFKPRLRDTDSLLVYFSGLCAVQSSPGGGFQRLLVTADADPLDLAAASVPLSDLVAWLKAADLHVGEVLLVLDCGFNGQTAGRSYGVRATDGDGFLREMAVGRVTVVTASDWNQGALCPAEFSEGAFSFFFQEALAGKADGAGDPNRKRDGMISLREVWTYTRLRMTELALLEGVEQTPQAYKAGARLEEGSEGDAQSLPGARDVLLEPLRGR